MGINIKIGNSQIGGNAEVMNNITGSDMEVEIDRVKIDHEAKVLNNMTDAQVENMLEQLKEQTKLLEKSGEDYRRIKALFDDIDKRQFSALGEPFFIPEHAKDRQDRKFSGKTISLQ